MEPIAAGCSKAQQDVSVRSLETHSLFVQNEARAGQLYSNSVVGVDKASSSLWVGTASKAGTAVEVSKASPQAFTVKATLNVDVTAKEYITLSFPMPAALAAYAVVPTVSYDWVMGNDKLQATAGTEDGKLVVRFGWAAAPSPNGPGFYALMHVRLALLAPPATALSSA